MVADTKPLRGPRFAAGPTPGTSRRTGRLAVHGSSWAKAFGATWPSARENVTPT